MYGAIVYIFRFCKYWEKKPNPKIQLEQLEQLEPCLLRHRECRKLAIHLISLKSCEVLGCSKQVCDHPFYWHDMQDKSVPCTSSRRGCCDST